jgi:hypothetical protein
MVELEGNLKLNLMKHTVIPLLLLIAIIIATILHSYRKNTYPIEDSFDRLSAGLNNIDRVLPLKTNISIYPVGVPTEVFLFSSYLLAPRCSRGNKNIKLDTVLSICPVGTPDSILHTTMKKKILWSNKDDQYQYYLTSNK